MLKTGDRCEWWNERNAYWRTSYMGGDTYYICELPEKLIHEKCKYVIINEKGYTRCAEKVRPYNGNNKKLSDLEAKQWNLAKQQVKLADEIAKWLGDE